MFESGCNKLKSAGKIAVMQNFVDGGKIFFRVRSENDWMLCKTPTWDWVRYEYRTETLPLTFYANVYPGTGTPSECYPRTNLADAVASLSAGRNGKSARFIEMTEEVVAALREEGVEF